MGDVAWTAERVAEALRRADLAREAERRAPFSHFGISAECLWPAALLYHQHSQFHVAWTPGLSDDEIEALTLSLDYKRYPDARRIDLPEAAPLSTGLEEAVRARRSTRTFSDEPLSFVDLARLLELSAGVIDRGARVPRRAAPSAGGLYPVELYVVALAVAGLPPGVYHYAPLESALEEVRTGPLDGLERSMRTALEASRPQAIIAMSSIFARSQQKYLERGYRFALLEAGHIAQNLTLAATALGLGSVCIGGFDDDAFNAFLGLAPEREVAIYTVFIGHEGAARGAAAAGRADPAAPGDSTLRGGNEARRAAPKRADP